jgi:drug/metabolite transporter, DME family
VASYPITFYPAVATAGVAVATVVALGSAPVFTGLLFWFAGEHPTTRWLLGAGLAIPGCAALVLGGATAYSAHPLGILLAALAGLSYTVYTVVSGRLIGQGHHPRAVLGTLFGGGGLLVVPVVLVPGGTALANPRTALVIGHLALVTTFLAYLLFGHGLRHTTAAMATTLTLIEPAVAALLGIVVLHGQLAAVSWAGLAVLGVAPALLTG